ncbi:MAG: hypothetical protein KF778_19360 [Rhodocyclaceae bacterium]|nr:hypothetical protein [Rhodocyclaceae bacterium]MBX3670567.1 hypothetical protein [Rhodocyclaceae bacterium]
MEASNDNAQRMVRHFREILLWPLQLMPLRESSQIQNHWEVLQVSSPDNPWREVEDEFTGDPGEFQQRHYSEFVTFLPHVRRFLYGDARGRASSPAESPIRVFRREDIQQVRCTFPDEDGPPLVIDVAHVDLYFFYDLDIIVLTIELFASNISLELAQEFMFRFGRTYPIYWERDGNGGHCPKTVEWLGANGQVLAVSDYENRDKFLRHVCEFRAPTDAAHWDFIMQPMVQHHSDSKGLLRYRHLEYHRMPVMGYLALEGDPRALTRADFMRLTLVMPPGDPNVMPVCGTESDKFEALHCYDRYWNDQAEGPPGSRYTCCGEGFMLVGSAQQKFFYTPSGGLLQQFRHQYFLLFLIPHMHKAALFMMADRLVFSLKRLDIQNPESVKRFKREIRQIKEIFLRFTHRYWFHHISDQSQARELYQRLREFLGTAELYQEVQERIEDMDTYLDSDSLRRQANTVVRLTVVTAFGLIGTTVTGYFGMNLLSLGELSDWQKFIYFIGILSTTTWVTFYTVMKSKRLSDFLDVLSDERESVRSKLGALSSVWRKKLKRPEA